MNSIKIRNLRSLVDTGDVELKPITLLVGANSSGKSSFIRFFPLLRQSVAFRTQSGLVLNEGDVNFGLFSEAICRHANPQELSFKFNFTIKPGTYQAGRVDEFVIEEMMTSCELTYAKRSGDSRYHYLCKVGLLLKSGADADLIEIKSDEDGKVLSFDVNGTPAIDIVGLRLRISRGMVPSIYREIESDDQKSTIGAPFILEQNPLTLKLLAETKGLFKSTTTDENRIAAIFSIKLGSRQEMLNAIKSIELQTWQKSVSGWTINSIDFLKIRNLLVARYAEEVLSSSNRRVTSLAESVHYFKPVRANVERDYLGRDVSIAGIDASGANVAMYLASLRHGARTKFREWTSKHFGFEIFPQSVSDGARVALRIKESGANAEMNLADVGFGFSQMLPFLVQIWALIERVNERNPWAPQRRGGEQYIIVIEQPELHLHPSMQAKLADLFVEVAKQAKASNISLHLMLETHSVNIVERIGAHIEAKSISDNDVGILLFERKGTIDKPGYSEIRRTKFNEDGILLDWPFGFLSAPPVQKINT